MSHSNVADVEWVRQEAFRICENESSDTGEEIHARICDLFRAIGCSLPEQLSAQPQSGICTSKLELSWIDDYNEDGKTLLLLLCEQEDDLVDTVKLLVERGGASIDVKDELTQDTPLSAACANGNLCIVRYLLLNMNANPNVFNKKMLTPLFASCAKGQIELTELLLQHPTTNLHLVNRDRMSCLHIASSLRPGNPHLISLLLSHLSRSTANPVMCVNSLSSNNSTPLLLACQSACNVEVIAALLQSGANPNIGNDSNIYPIIIACQRNAISVVQLLINSRAELNDLPNVVDKPIHIAVQLNSIELTKLLLDNGSDVNCKDSEDQTPLLSSVLNCTSAITDVLLAHGANLQEDIVVGGYLPLYTIGCLHRDADDLIRAICSGASGYIDCNSHHVSGKESKNTPSSRWAFDSTSSSSGTAKFSREVPSYPLHSLHDNEINNTGISSNWSQSQLKFVGKLLAKRREQHINRNKGNNSNNNTNSGRANDGSNKTRHSNKSNSSSSKNHIKHVIDEIFSHNIYFSDENGFAYLIAAVNANAIDILYLLIEAGANFIRLYEENSYFRQQLTILEEKNSTNALSLNSNNCSNSNGTNNNHSSVTDMNKIRDLCITIQYARYQFPLHVAIRLYYPVRFLRSLVKKAGNHSHDASISVFTIDYHQLSLFQVAEMCNRENYEYLAEILSLCLPVNRHTKEALLTPYDFCSANYCYNNSRDNFNSLVGTSSSNNSRVIASLQGGEDHGDAIVEPAVSASATAALSAASIVDFPTCRLNAPIHIIDLFTFQHRRISCRNRTPSLGSAGMPKVYFECLVHHGKQAQIGLALHTWTPPHSLASPSELGIEQDSNTLGVGDSSNSISFDGFRSCIWVNGLSKINLPPEDIDWKAGSVVGVVVSVCAVIDQSSTDVHRTLSSDNNSNTKDRRDAITRLVVTVCFYLNGNFISEVDWPVEGTSVNNVYIVPTASVDSSEYIEFDFGLSHTRNYPNTNSNNHHNHLNSSTFLQRMPNDAISVARYFHYRIPRVLELFDRVHSFHWIRCVREDSYSQKLVITNSKYNYFDWIWCVSHDAYEDIIRHVLKHNTQLILSLSKNCVDIDGRRAIDVATPRCKAALEDELYLFGRFEIANIAAPLHESKSSLVVLGFDHTSSFTSALYHDDTSNSTTASGYDNSSQFDYYSGSHSSQAQSYPNSNNNSIHSSNERVALKLMKTKTKFNREILVREILSGYFNNELQRVSKGNSQFGRQISRSRSASVSVRTPESASINASILTTSQLNINRTYNVANFPPYVPILYQYDSDEDETVIHELMKRWATRDIRYCIVMPICERTLHDVLIHEFIAGLNWKEIKHILSQLCQAVSYLHSLNIIHGDIKPLNIVRNSSGHIKLIDFDAALYAHSNNYLTWTLDNSNNGNESVLSTNGSNSNSNSNRNNRRIISHISPRHTAGKDRSPFLASNDNEDIHSNIASSILSVASALPSTYRNVHLSSAYIPPELALLVLHQQKPELFRSGGGNSPLDATNHNSYGNSSNNNNSSSSYNILSGDRSQFSEALLEQYPRYWDYLQRFNVNSTVDSSPEIVTAISIPASHSTAHMNTADVGFPSSRTLSSTLSGSSVGSTPATTPRIMSSFGITSTLTTEHVSQHATSFETNEPTTAAVNDTAPPASSSTAATISPAVQPLSLTRSPTSVSSVSVASSSSSTSTPSASPRAVHINLDSARNRINHNGNINIDSNIDSNSDSMLDWSPLIDFYHDNPWLTHDIWALGAVFYEVCCGAALFQSIRDSISTEQLCELSLWTESLKINKLNLIEDEIDNYRGRNLISQMLTSDSSKRPTITEIEDHPFFTFKWVPRFRNEEPMYDIFLSYRVDSDLGITERIYNTLTEGGFRVWWDKRCLTDGEVWNCGFCQGLMSCKVFMPLISRSALFHGKRDCSKYTSHSAVDNVLLEYRLALELKEMNYITRIYPVFVGERIDDDSDSPCYSRFDFAHGPSLAAPVTVEALEADLIYHLDQNLSLGFPTAMGLTVREILERIYLHNGYIQFEGAVNDILEHLLGSVKSMFTKLNSNIGSNTSNSSSSNINSNSASPYEPTASAKSTASPGIIGLRRSISSTSAASRSSRSYSSYNMSTKIAVSSINYQNNVSHGQNTIHSSSCSDSSNDSPRMDDEMDTPRDKDGPTNYPGEADSASNDTTMGHIHVNIPIRSGTAEDDAVAAIGKIE